MSVSDLIEDLLLAEIRPPSPGVAPAESQSGKGLSPHSPHSPVDLGAHRHWQIHFADHEALEVIFTPEATRTEVGAPCPGARIESRPASSRPSATPAEAGELRELIALILPDADEAEQAQALAVALADPEAALASFRALAADLRPNPAPYPDDRRACRECANLDRQRGRDGFRRCAAARRGELPYIAHRDYCPVPDQPQRCVGYLPHSDDPDQRTGRERWAGL